MASKGRTNVGLFLNVFYNEYAVRIWTGASKAAAELGVGLIAYADNSVDSLDPAVRERAGLYRLADLRSIDGIVFISPTIADDASRLRLERFYAAFSSLPMVHVGVAADGRSRISAENSMGMLELVNHFIERHGRTRVAFIKGPNGSADAEIRFQAYKTALETHGLPYLESLVLQGDFTRDSGAAAAIELLDRRRERFDALVAANDNMALYAMKELQRRGLRIPADVSIGGFDDFLAARSSVPALCTVHQPAEEMGAEALRIVTAAIADDAPPRRPAAFSTRFVPRRSCGCLVSGSDEYEHESAGSTEPLIDETGLEALRSALASEPGAKFRGLLEESVTKSYERRIPVASWLRLTPSMTSALSPEARPDAERDIAHLLFSLQEEMTSRGLLARIEESSIFDELTGGIIRSFDAESIRLFLASHFSGEGAFLCLSIMQEGSERAEVLYCTDKSLIGAVFDPAILVPGGRDALPRRSDLIVLPLSYGTDVLGFIVCSSEGRPPSFYETLREHLGGALEGASLVARIREQNATLERQVETRTKELAQALEELGASNEKLAKLTVIDELTGLYNRRGFLDLAGKQLELAARRNSSVLLLYVDMDSLKAINDKHGHAEGDEAIKTVAQVLTKAFRQTDIVARLGGDEFTVLAIDSPPGYADAMVQRALSHLDEINASSIKPYALGFSFGVASSAGRKKGKLSELLAEADARLYEAKRAKKRARGGASFKTGQT